MQPQTSTTSGSINFISPEAGTGSNHFFRKLAATVVIANGLFAIPPTGPSINVFHVTPEIGTSVGAAAPTGLNGADEVDNDGEGNGPTPREKLRELRHISGLTWAQIAALLNVDRRSVHLWESGRALHPKNEEKLGRLLAVIREIDRGFASANRSILTSPTEDNRLPLDMLAANEFSNVIEALGRADARQGRARAEISASLRARHTPPHPLDLIVDSNQSQRVKVGRAIAFRPIKLGKRDA